MPNSIIVLILIIVIVIVASEDTPLLMLPGFFCINSAPADMPIDNAVFVYAGLAARKSWISAQLLGKVSTSQIFRCKGYRETNVAATVSLRFL